MASKINTSVNIVRDSNKEIDYIPTLNGIKTIELITNDFSKGLRSFNIIGSYGTGKSSFLWAFQNSFLNTSKANYNIKNLPHSKTDFINIIGEYGSLFESICEKLELSSKEKNIKSLLAKLKRRFEDLKSKNSLLIILIDEFGKFLEYATKNNSEKELYFIQQLTEFINNEDYNIILITTVHQNFEEYAYSSNSAPQNEWIKIKGRFREITFNEPVDQLLYLAAKRIKNYTSLNNRNIEHFNNVILESKCFPLNPEFINEISNNLYPLDIFAANIITSALQKYGQNERSLFSFIESSDEYGMQYFKENKKGFYNISNVYDYLYFNFYSFLNSKYNPDFSHWKSIQNSIEKLDSIFSNNDTHKAIIKTIGLINVFIQNNFSLGKELLIDYCNRTLEIKNSKEILNELIEKKVIIYREYNKRYVLFEGTDLDIQTALIESSQKISQITDIATLLNKYYQLPSVVAKEETYKKGTPRLFEYRITSSPIKETPSNEIDGFINLVFNDKITKQEIIDCSKQNKEAILYGYFKNSSQVKETLFEIEKIKKVIIDNADDKVAIKELNNLLNYHVNELNDGIQNHYNAKSESIYWFFEGEPQEINNKKEFNKLLSKISNKYYSKTPIFNNELVNKHKISPTIHTAKRNFFRAIVNNWDKTDLGFPADKYPPEKTIYLTLFKNNGIDLNTDVSIINETINKKNKINILWNTSSIFLDGCKTSKRRISELYNLLSKKPFKLKQGFLDFWVPAFLFIQRNEFALFNEYGYIPNINEDIIELICKYPDRYEVKKFDIDGVKLDIFNSYRTFLNQEQKTKFTNSNFIQTIKPFLTFYKNLPDFSKNTKRLGSEAISIRSTIANSKDPEKTFFEEFPTSLGYNIEKIQKDRKELQLFILKLENSVREIRSSYDNLISRIEEFIKTEIVHCNSEFKDYKKILQKRYKKIKRHLLLSNQKSLLQKIDSEIDDKVIWLNSIVQILIGTTLERLKDEDEAVLYEKISKSFQELDDLLELSSDEIDESSEENISITIGGLGMEFKKKIIRVPKEKQKVIKELEEKINLILSKHDNISTIILSNLLKEKL